MDYGSYGIRNNAVQGFQPWATNSDANQYAWIEGMRREQEAKERAAQQQDPASFILQQMMGGGNPGNTPQQPRQPGFPDGPMTSMFPGYSYKTRGSAPRYHEEIPMGGTRGVWAIRNDELLRGGPQQDAWWVKRAQERHRGRRGFNNRFQNRRI